MELLLACKIAAVHLILDLQVHSQEVLVRRVQNVQLLYWKDP